MKISRVGVDLAKNVFQLHGADDKGETVWKRKLSRDKWLKVTTDTKVRYSLKHSMIMLRKKHDNYLDNYRQ